MPDMQEIRWHGRGGQGVKTAATFLAESALHQGKYSQGFPDYGPERMGAPVRGYTRISDQPIRVHTEIEEPDAVVVIDSTLISQEIIQGIKSGGDAVINSQFPPEHFRRAHQPKVNQQPVPTGAFRGIPAPGRFSTVRRQRYSDSP